MDKGGEYSLKWNSHKSTVMSAFTCLFESERHADCTLAAEGQLIKVHKVMISACSPYLERLLEDHSKDKSSHPIVIFNDMSYFELKALCEYMYKGEVNVPMENLESFLKIAKCMQVRGLCDGGGGDSIGGLDGGKPGSSAMSKVSSQQQQQQQVDKRCKVAGSQLLASPSGSDKQPQHHHPHHQPAKRKRLEQAAFDSDNSTDNVAYISSSPRGGRGGKVGVKQQGGKVVGTCSPRVVQEVKPELTTVKTEEPEPVYEETVYQDLTFEEEIYPDTPVVTSEQASSASNNDSTLEFGNWNDGNSNDFNQDSANQEQAGSCGSDTAGGENVGGDMELMYGREERKLYKRNHGIFPCGQCGRTYIRKDSLQRHILWECGKEPQFQCPFCPQKCKRKSHHLRHMQRQHRDLLDMAASSKDEIASQESTSIFPFVKTE